MDIRNRRELKQFAFHALSQSAYPPNRLALIHAALALGVSLLLTILQFVLAGQLDSTGGLAGMDTRSVITTIQAVLNLANMVLLPFWELGFVYCAIKMARQEEVGVPSLFEGFRRFFPALRLFLLQAVIYAVVVFLCIQLSTALYLFSPFSQPLMALLETYMGNPEFVPDETTLSTLLPSVIPLYVILGAVVCLLLIPVSYRFRMAQFVLMDAPDTGALKALGNSHRMMRYNRFALFRLDLSLWWFYGLQILSTLLCYGDMLLPAFGVTLPISEAVSFFLFFVLHLILQLVLFGFSGSYVKTVYASAYEALRPEQEDRTTKNLPWDLLP